MAAEGHYHGQCYREHTRPPKLPKSDENNNAAGLASERNHEAQYAETEKLCYDELFTYIRNVLFQKLTVVRLTELTQRLLEFFRNRGETEVKVSTKKHIYRKLACEFGDSLHMIPDDKGKILVFPANLLLKDLVKENIHLRDELRVLKDRTSETEKMIENVSRIIRSDVRELGSKMPWPPTPADLKAPLEYIPCSLQLFLKVLFSGEICPSSDRVRNLVESVGQDIVYGVTSARVKPPKNILLPQAVKALSRNVELIQILNRYSHGISYSQMEELDTALALKKLETQDEDIVALPDDIHPNIMATLAWDNIDRLEDTLSGGGTSHRVNGIVVQPKSYGPHLAPRDELHTSAQESGRKQRTLTLIQPLLPVYNSGERVGPSPRGYIEVTDSEMKCTVYRKTLLWLLVRLHNATNQNVCGWTGFNISVRDKEKVAADVVGYLPTINAPAPQLSTVHEILIQSQNIRCSLSLQSIVVVFDQALYAKATEIIWKHSDNFSDVYPD